MYLNIDDLWWATVETLLNKGHETESRVGKTKELLGYSNGLSNIDQTFLLNRRRRLSPAYACAEILWYLSMTGVIEMMLAYAPQYTNYAENDVAFGAYGARWKKYDQLEHLIKVLRQSSNSRQAVMTMWAGSDLLHAVTGEHKDLPCTLSLQFLIRDNRLHLIATMRSNDAWLGLPYDVFAFTCLQWLVASALQIEPGTYTHQVGSMHLYEKNWTAAGEALRHGNCFFNEHRRLTHEWVPFVPDPWQEDVDRAVSCEQVIRDGGHAVLFPYNTMLRDCVLCCATKWIDWSHMPKSPILLKGVENAKK